MKKNKIISIVVLIILIISNLLLLSGCKWNSNGTKRKVEAKLKEKYNQSFSTSAVGNRWNTDHTTLWCYPTNDKDLLFEVVYYDNGKMTDDYIERKFERELERELISAMNAVNIQATCKIDIEATGRDENKNYEKMSLNEYIEDVKTECLWARLAVNADSIKTEVDAENLVNVLEKFSNKHNSVGVLIPLYFAKADQYNEVEEYFKTHTSIEDTIHNYTKNSDKSQRETTIFVNRTTGSKTEIYPISIMEAVKVH